MHSPRIALLRRSLRILEARPRALGTSVLVVGAVLGSAFVLLAGSAVAYRAQEPQAAMLEAAHLPPLLTAPGEPVELRYDVFCSTSEETDESPCDAAGSVFVRTGGAGPFAQLQLRVEPSAVDGRYVAFVPPSIARSGRGFSYYAVFVSERAGQTLTLPAGGADAPQQSLPLDRAVEVHIGKHTFGAVRRADAAGGARCVGQRRAGDRARAGSRPPTHRRILVRCRSPRDGSSSSTRSTDDCCAGEREPRPRSTYLLQSTARSQTCRSRTTARSTSSRPQPRHTGRCCARSVRAGRPRAQRRSPSEPRRRCASARAVPSSFSIPRVSGCPQRSTVGRSLAQAQKRAGRAGRAVPGVGDVVVLRVGSEIRAAVADANGVRRAWRVTSDTPLAEIQLAEPVGNRLVLVVRAYTDDDDEFVALVLGPTGLLSSFALDSADWAETAPLSRFRLAGSALYQLGSTPAGVFVDRFELEVK